jgi:hypothetical protein
MSKDFQNQKANITGSKGAVAYINGLDGSPFGRDIVGRAVNKQTAKDNSTKNTQRYGNPLSVVANEQTPNPARRMREMKAVKANARPSKGL